MSSIVPIQNKSECPRSPILPPILLGVSPEHHALPKSRKFCPNCCCNSVVFVHDDPLRNADTGTVVAPRKTNLTSVRQPITKTRGIIMPQPFPQQEILEQGQRAFPPVILLLKQGEHSSPAERIIQDRLEHLGYRVEDVPASKVGQADVQRVELMVICTPGTASRCRMESIPMLVCSHETLYDLGMTCATPDVDFGTDHSTNYATIVPGDLVLTAGLSGAVCVSQASNRVHWGKPNANAAVAANVAGSGGKAALFAYERGAVMPGLIAPHRRAACLFATEASLTPESQRLLKACVEWLLRGGGQPPKSINGAGGIWFMDGQPTKVLAIDEYRSWVKDQVVSGLQTRLLSYTTILTFLIGTIVLGLGNWFMQNAIDKSVESRTKTEVYRLLTETSLPKAVAEKAKETEKEVSAKATTTATTAAERRIKEELDPTKLDPKIDDAFNKKVPERLRGTLSSKNNADLQQKMLALQFLTFFEKDADKLRDDLKQVLNADSNRDAKLKRNKEQADFIIVALRAYQPNDKDDDTLKLLLDMVPQSATEQPPFRKALELTLARFPAEKQPKYATLVGDWLKANPKSGLTSNLVLGALVQMKGDKPIQILTDFLINPETSELAQRGLKGIDPARELSPEVRRKAIKIIWNQISAIDPSKTNRTTKSVEYLGALMDGFHEVREWGGDRAVYTVLANEITGALVPGNPVTITARAGESNWIEILKNFLRPNKEEWEWVLGELQLRAKDEPRRDQLDYFLMAWVRRMQINPSKQGELEELLLERCFNASNPLFRSGTASAMQIALMNCQDKSVTRFLDKFPELIKDSTGNRPFLGQRALEMAVRRDADRKENKLEATKKLMNSAKPDDRKLAAELVRALKPAVYDPPVREWLLGKTAEGDVELYSWQVRLGAVMTLAALKDPIESKRVGEKLLSLVDSLKKTEVLVEPPADSNAEWRKQRLVHEIVNTLSAYLLIDGEPRPFLDKVLKKVNEYTKEDASGTTFACHQLARLLANRGDLRAFGVAAELKIYGITNNDQKIFFPLDLDDNLSNMTPVVARLAANLPNKDLSLPTFEVVQRIPTKANESLARQKIWIDYWSKLQKLTEGDLEMLRANVLAERRVQLLQIAMRPPLGAPPPFPDDFEPSDFR